MPLKIWTTLNWTEIGSNFTPKTRTQAVTMDRPHPVDVEDPEAGVNLDLIDLDLQRSKLCTICG